MQVDLAGQVAVVTGGAGAIGRAIVRDLATNGARVLIVDVQADSAAQAVDEEEKLGGSCACEVADVADGEAMAQVAQRLRRDYGRLDLLINNAGINTGGGRVPIHEYRDADWEAIVRIDLTGVFATSRALIPLMLEGDGGRIVNIASVAGLVPLRLQSAFVAAKAGVVNLTKSMALELGPQGILTNCVAPGSTLTPGTEALFYGADGAYSEKAQALLSHIPLGRPGTTAEIAHSVLFLCAPEASYINGVAIAVDGGWTAGYTRDF